MKAIVRVGTRVGDTVISRVEQDFVILDNMFASTIGASVARSLTCLSIDPIMIDGSDFVFINNYKISLEGDKSSCSPLHTAYYDNPVDRFVFASN